MRLAMTFTALVNAFFLLAIPNSQGRTWQDGLEGTFEGMSYRYYLPADYDESIEYPLVLFLHGSGRSGTDNERQVSQNISRLITKTESEYPAILFAPQLPLSVGWSPFQPIDHTSEILAQLVDTLSVDSNRLYLTGFSMGGFGSMEYVQRYNAEELSDLRFAAVAPLSGSFISTGRPGVPEGLLDTPIWLLHGDRDVTVDVESARHTFRVLAGLEPTDPIPFDNAVTFLRNRTAIVGNARYTELAGKGHNIRAPVYRDNIFYDWMFAQSIAVPEPSTLLLAAISGVALLFRRRPKTL